MFKHNTVSVEIIAIYFYGEDTCKQHVYNLEFKLSCPFKMLRILDLIINWVI